MAEQIPDGATVWIKNAEKNSTEAFVKATVVKLTQGRGYTVKQTNGPEKVRAAVAAAAAARRAPPRR